ncbi:Zn(II)2Cys6 transcription factor, partial [Aspergillus homomorphus CBS 101889]
RVKCDRKKPCNNCVRRGEHANCIYAAHPPAAGHRRSDLNRLNLPGALAHDNDITSPSDTASIGCIHVNGNETHYVGGEHWAVIADNQSSPWPDLLLGLRECSTTRDLLASVPPKAEVDRLISRYFNSLDLAAWISHGPTFQEDYERFWNGPTTVSLNWLSILFSMMCLATDILLQSGEMLPSNGASAQESVILFRKSSAQCLILGDYTKPTAYTVDALLLYFYCELLRFQDTHFGLDVVLATIVRVAMRMGYHRDPSHYPAISIFEGEMRRRVWALLIQLDILVSLQFGLPRMINERDSDTRAPRNIPTEEMSPDMTALPPSRPESGAAVSSYMRSRTTLVSILGLIHSHVTSVHPLSYETVIQLHEMLNEQHEALPIGLKVRECAPVTDSAAVVMRRLSLDLLFQKSRCVLHRRYMRPQNRLSWETCIDAALMIIRHQSYVYRETQSGGLLSGHLWKITYLATYDFLLASMLLCLGLHWGVNAESDGVPAIGLHSNGGRYSALLSALEDSYTIWAEWCTDRNGSKRVLEIVKLMLDRVKRDGSLSSFGEHSKQSTATAKQGSGLGMLLSRGNLRN